MRVKILLATDTSVIPLQLLHIPKSPFFGSFYKISIFPFRWDFLILKSSGIGGATYVVVIGSAFRVLISAFEGGFNNISASLVTGSCQLLCMLVISTF